MLHMVIFEQMIYDDIMEDTYEKNIISKILELDIHWFKLYDHLKFQICRKIAKSEKIQKCLL